MLFFALSFYFDFLHDLRDLRKVVRWKCGRYVTPSFNDSWRLRDQLKSKFFQEQNSPLPAKPPKIFLVFICICVVYSLFRFLLTSAPFCCYSIFLSCLTFGERIQIQNIINFQVQNHLTKISHLKDLYTPWNSASLPLKIGPINAPKGNEKVFPSIHFLGANLLLVSEFVYTTPAPPMKLKYFNLKKWWVWSPEAA